MGKAVVAYREAPEVLGERVRVLELLLEQLERLLAEAQLDRREGPGGGLTSGSSRSNPAVERAGGKGRRPPPRSPPPEERRDGEFPVAVAV
jgi:hypothetical protein